MLPELDTLLAEMEPAPYATGDHGSVSEASRRNALGELHEAGKCLASLVEAVQVQPDDDARADELVDRFQVAFVRACAHMQWFRNARDCQGQA